MTRDLKTPVSIAPNRGPEGRAPSAPSRCHGRVAPGRRGFTLVEMLTTVAVLIILLGLMVSLARYVRRRSAEDTTRRILLSLDRAMGIYLKRLAVDGSVEQQKAFLASFEFERMDEASLLAQGLENNHRFVKELEQSEELAVIVFTDLPRSIYESGELRDAWGMPILFVPRVYSAIGMAPEGRSFFFSAGPDRLYLTRDDNQYSYESPQRKDKAGQRE